MALRGVASVALLFHAELPLAYWQCLRYSAKSDVTQHSSCSLGQHPKSFDSSGLLSFPLGSQTCGLLG